MNRVARKCRLEGCNIIVMSPAEWCGEAHRAKAYRARKKAARGPAACNPVVKTSSVREWLKLERVKRFCQKCARRGVKFTHLSRKQKEFFEDFIDEGVQEFIGIANRRFAKTFLAALAALYKEDEHEGDFKVTILSGSEEQAGNCYEFVTIGLDDPDCFGYLLEGKTTRKHSKMKGGGWIKILVTSEKSTRGKGSDLLIIDEFCQVDNQILTSAFAQLADAKDAMLRFIGTPEDYTSLVREYWEEQNDIVKFHANWRECHHLNLEYLKRMREKLTKDEWEIEFEALWRARTGNVYPLDQVEAAVVNFVPKGMIFDEIRIGIDVGKKHFTVITVIGSAKNVWYVLEILHFRDELFEKIREAILQVWKKYKKPRIYIEESPISYYLIELLEHDVYIGEGERINFASHKEEWADNLAFLLENQAIKIPRKYRQLIDQIAELHYDKQGKIAKINDDFFDSLVYALGRGSRVAPGDNFVMFEDIQAGGESNIFVL